MKTWARRKELLSGISSINKWWQSCGPQVFLHLLSNRGDTKLLKWNLWKYITQSLNLKKKYYLFD